MPGPGVSSHTPRGALQVLLAVTAATVGGIYFVHYGQKVERQQLRILEVSDERMADGVHFKPPEELHGVFWFSVFTSFFLAFTIGANDVANNFGTSVGSGAVSMRTAIYIAGFAEVLGAVTLGSGVSDTIVRGISDLDSSECWDCGGESSIISLFMLGMACALAAGAAFLLAATLLKMPVSTTHTVVGAIIGMTMVGAGPPCVKWGWPGLASISASWVLSPVLAGILSSAVLWFVRSRLLGARLPVEATLACMPFLGGGTLATFAALLVMKAHATRGWPTWLTLLVISLVFGAGAAGTHLLFVPYLRRSCRAQGLKSIKMARNVPEGQNTDVGGTGADEDGQDNGVADMAEVELKQDREAVEWDEDDGFKAHEVAAAEKVFMYLQVLTACLKSYAHGANDTANAAGPFTAVQALYIHGADDCDHVQTPFWVLAAGGLGIVLGLTCLGHKVMETIGSGLTNINFSRGFSIELGSTVAVVVASVVGMPVSSTHCQVGSIVAVGLMESGSSAVNWRLFSKIAVSWLVTVPAAALMAAALLAATSGAIKL